jgi:nucleolar protein 53
MIEVPAIVEPHQGTSYNPPVDAHQELLEKAASLEMKRLRDAEKMAEVKTKMEEAKLTAEEYDMSVLPGMKVQELHADEDQPEEDEEVSISAKKVPERKTKVQRNRAARLLAEVSLSLP